MTLIGGRIHGAASAAPGLFGAGPKDAGSIVVRPGLTSSDPVEAEIARALIDFHGRLAAQTVVGSVPGVHVHLRLDGEIERIVIDESVQVRFGAPRVGELVIQAFQRAVAEAAGRREEVAEQVTFFGEPVLRKARRMVTDPDETREELTGVRYW